MVLFLSKQQSRHPKEQNVLKPLKALDDKERRRKKTYLAEQQLINRYLYVFFRDKPSFSKYTSTWETNHGLIFSLDNIHSKNYP